MKPITFVIYCMLFSFQCLSQKLPDIQKGGLRAPDDIKIDGVLNEWKSLSAYNKRVNIYYTIANDKDNLYLAVKADNYFISSKILQGGLKFSVNVNQPSEKGAVIITYPVVDDKETISMMKIMPKPSATYHLMSAAEKKEEGARLNKETTAFSRKVTTLFKFIGVSGVAQINNKQIPIYNDLDIKVAALMEDSKNLNYEMAIPLKYFNLPNGSAMVSYNIKLIGKHVPGGVVIQQSTNPDGSAKAATIRRGIDSRTMMADTDFWGEYVLIK